jgi:DNA-binding beta-propeller fold protein YncE
MARHRLLVLVLFLGWSGSVAGNPSARIFFLDLRGRLVSATPEGADRQVLIDGLKGQPDGIAVDVEAGHIYWTNMGDYAADDGSIERSNLDGSNVTTIVKAGGTWTGKQLVLDKANGKLYWSDREGLRVMRANLDGSGLETLIETGRGDEARKDQRNWCVGMAVDVAGGKIYWTQKGGDNANVGTIRRANLDIPRGQTALNRTDIEVLFDGLPEPIDLELDLAKRHLYWTDRGNPPDGNTVNRAAMDAPRERVILAGGFNETIGIALDLDGGRMFLTDLRGSVYSLKLDGSDRKTLFTDQGMLTGIAHADLTRRATSTRQK